MNKAEFNKAIALASFPLEGAFDNIGMFNGFGLSSFKPVCCTLSAMAGLIKWQAMQFNGQLDSAALNEIWEARRKFIIASDV